MGCPIMEPSIALHGPLNKIWNHSLTLIEPHRAEQISGILQGESPCWEGSQK